MPSDLRLWHLDHTAGELGMGCEQPAQRLHVAALERRHELDGDRIIASQRAGACHRRAVWEESQPKFWRLS
jgi:hypothetical protein